MVAILEREAGIWLIGAQNATKHPTLHSMVSTTKNFLVQTSKVSKLKNFNEIFAGFEIYKRAATKQGIFERKLNILPRDE